MVKDIDRKRENDLGFHVRLSKEMLCSDLKHLKYAGRNGRYEFIS